MPLSVGEKSAGTVEAHGLTVDERCCEGSRVVTLQPARHVDEQREARGVGLREAVFSDRKQIDPRTTVLVSLTNGSDLLRKTFGRQEIKARKKRIEQITQGDLTGQASREVIAAGQAALIVAAVIPAVVTSSVSS